MASMSKLQAAGIGGALLLAATAVVIPFEGRELGVYVDPANILTSCYGHTGPELKQGQRFTEEQCLAQLADDLGETNRLMLSVVKVPLTESEHAAYLSFVYNVGSGNWQQSTALKYLNRGERRAACDQLLRWIYINKKPSNGLKRRRTAEHALCVSEL